MENRGMLPNGWEPLKPTAAEIADYKHRKEAAAKVEKALMLGVDQLAEALMISARACSSEEPAVYMRGMTRREVVNAVNALGNVAHALNYLNDYTIPPYGYTEEMEDESDAEG